MPSKVSILIPTYNRAAYLREAIASALNQTYHNVEILVLDDCSPDSTGSVVEEFSSDPRLRYIRHERNLGIAGNWRAGITAATGEFFCILHDDDTIEPDFVESLARPLVRIPSLCVCFCDHWVTDSHGTRNQAATDDASRQFRRDNLPEGRLADFARSALVDYSIPIGASVFRRSVVTADMIDDRAQGGIDMWLLYQCIRTGLGAYYVPRRLMNYRQHSGSMSASMPLYNGEGHLYRFRAILADPQLRSIHADIRVMQADCLTNYGLSLLSLGRRADARAVLLESIRIRKSPRAMAALGLSYLGRAGSSTFALIRTNIRSFWRRAFNLSPRS